MSPQALLAGLLLRIERDAHVPERREIDALFALGIPRDEVRRRMAERADAHTDAPFPLALAALDAIP